MDEHGQIIGSNTQAGPPLRCGKCRLLLRLISLGKYETKLYHRGMDSQSSSFGGAVTLLFWLALAVYSYFFMISVFHRDYYNMESSTEET
jgi:hypothetical protein